MHHARFNSIKDMIEWLIEQGKDINYISNLEQTDDKWTKYLLTFKVD